MTWRHVAVLLVGSVLLTSVLLTGCARGGEEGGSDIPESVLEVWVKFAGSVSPSAYYYVAIDTDGDYGSDYPVPIATGPYWGNGWGTGAITHFMQYHLSTYSVYRANLSPVLRRAGGGITEVGGRPTGGEAGSYTLTVGPLTLGQVTVSGSGTVAAVTNESDQNAGTFSLETDAAGQTVAAGVSFTPAADGGREPTGEQLAQLATLNAGGVPLATTSLSTFGLTLSLGSPAAGTQTLAVAPTVASVESRFVPAYAGAGTTRTTTVTANSSTATTTPPIPGGTVTAGNLITGGKADIDVEISQSPALIGWPYEYVLPGSGTTLKALIDLTDLGTNLDNLSINIITTTELIYDPNVTDPADHCYDGLGPLGNDAINISAQEFTKYTNAGAFVPEGANDTTLQGNVSTSQRAAVDIVDWYVAIRRLR